MKRYLPSFLLALLFQAQVFAQGLYLNSLGSKASAMGGAFLGLADDLSAVSMNPAGMAQFDERYFGLSGGGLLPHASYMRYYAPPGSGNVTVIDTETPNNIGFSGLAAYYHPLGDRWVAGIGLYTPVRSGMTWNGAAMAAMANGNTSIDWMSSIKVTTISPALGYRVGRTVLVGASINIDHGQFMLARHAGIFNLPLPEPPYIEPIELGQYRESLSGWGCGATFGVLVKPNDSLGVGAVVRMASRVHYLGEARVDGFDELGVAFSRDLRQVAETEKTIVWPLSLGLGVSFKPVRVLTFTADLRWTDWSSWDALRTEYQDPLWASYMSERGNDVLELSWEDTLEARVGIEYRLPRRLAIRVGAFVARSPAPEEALNVFLPAFGFRAVTFGLGYRHKEFQLDLGFDYAASRNKDDVFSHVPVFPPPYGSSWENANFGDYSMKKLVLSLSLAYRFGPAS